METKAIYAALLAVQQGLKAPKAKDGGKYHYRSAEDILEKVKPLLQENGLALIMDEDICTDSIGSYIKTTATLIDIASGDTIQTRSMAREDVGTKFMSPGQATGAAVSYSRKYALCGLFAIDNEEDLDSPAYQKERKGGKGNEEQARAQAVRALNKAIASVGCTGAEASVVAGAKYGKTTIKELSVSEIQDLTANLDAYIAEAVGA